jgi:hypothetical protein
MRMVATMTSVLFFVSGPVAVVCFVILISSVCPRHSESSQRDVNSYLLFASVSAWGPFWNPMPRPRLLLPRPPGEGGVGFP